MAPLKVHCPQCQAALKLPANMPAGARPKCPRCGTPVPVAGGNGALQTAVPLPARNTAIASNTSVSRHTALADRVDNIAEASGSRGVNLVVALGIIVGGGVLALALAVGLVVLCLSGESKKDPVTAIVKDDDEPPAPQTGKTKIAAKQNKPPAANSFIALSAENEKKVESATQRGVDYLKRMQIQDGPDKGGWKCLGGYDVGYAGLAGLTLLESKVAPNDPAIQNAAIYLRARIGKAFNHYETYQISVAILFLSRLDDPADRPLIRSLALRLVASQYPSGGWHYLSAPLTPQQEAQVLAMLKDYKSYAGAGAIGPLAGREMGAFQPVKVIEDAKFFRSGGDNSNTQFALLALWAARRYDLPLDEPLRLVAKRFRNSQQPNGTWLYFGENHTVSQYPTMTAAGLLGLAVGYGLESDGKGAKVSGDMAQDKVLQAAFRKLAEKVGNPGDDRKDPPEMYFLWSVERVAVLYQLARIDGKDWYHWGLDILLTHQQQDGRWQLLRGPGTSDIVDTCFALLFLQRANLAKDLTDKIQALAAALGQMQRKE